MPGTKAILHMVAKKKAVLVTGAAGFVGFHLVKKLVAHKIDVVGFDSLNDYYNPALKIDRLKELGISVAAFQEYSLCQSSTSSFTFFKGDLESEQTWQVLKTNFDIVSIVHLAAQAGVRYSLEQPRKYISANILGFLNVLEFCRETGLKKLIYASSSSVYGMDSQQPFSEMAACDKPVSLYAATKRSNELMAYTYWHLNGIESIGLRFFTVYGPWGRPDMAPFLFTKAAFENTPIKVFNQGNQSRDFTYVDDIVNGIYQVFTQQEKISGATECNIGHGSPVKLMDFIAAIETTSGKSLQKQMLPAQPGDVAHTYADTSILQNNFGYQPTTDLATGVAAFVAWYANYFKIAEKAPHP
jgi:UDP-glucuronate 4-epimerase